ncbi:MAG TPA: PAS domain S-box protein [Steroidobacteraceae bacterium]|nr:PAS domain S-box protein [Steroidobacteraceae bacterium]
MGVTAIALVASLLWLGATVYSLARDTQFVRQGSDRREVIEKSRIELQTALILLNNAETGQRGYLLTGKERYLTPYRDAVTELPALLGRLAALNRQIGLPSRLSADVQHNATLKLDELADTIQLEKGGKHTAAVSLVTTDAGQRLMEKLRADIAALAAGLVEQNRTISEAIVQRVTHRERLTLLAACALLVSLLLAATQAVLLFAAHRRFEIVLAASEQKHRALVDEQTEIIALVRPDGRLSYTNPALGRFFGVSAAALQESMFLDLLLPADRSAMDAALKSAPVAGESIAIESRALSPDGQERWFSWRLRLQQGPGSAPRVHAVGRDVTIRKAAEAALRASEDFLRRTGRVAGIGGWEINLSTGELRWSTQVRRILGVDDDYVPTVEKAFDFFTAEARLTLRRAMDDARFRGISWDLELPLIPTSGHQIHVRAVGEAELGADGVPFRLVGTLQDVTDRHRLEKELRELTEVFDNTTDLVAQTDWQGRVHFINKSARRALGFDESKPLEGHTFREFYTPETNERFLREIVPAVKRAGVWIGETQVVLKDSRVVPVNHMVIGHFDLQGRVSRYSSLMRDITEDVAARRQLARQTAMLNTIIEAIPAMVAVFDRDMRYLLVNKGYERWRGVTRAELIGRTAKETMDPVEFEINRPWAERALAGETVSYEKEYPDAVELRFVSLTYLPLRLDDDSIVGFFGVAQDITEHREENLRLLLLAERDPLTGLLNRAGLEQFVESRMRQGEASALAVIYIDLDYFKPVNDMYGHSGGDRVLCEFALRLLGLVRPTDAVARIGGDEFAVILSGIRSAVDAGKVAEKIVYAARQPFSFKDDEILISASVGVACDASGGWQALVDRADAMVYRAKASGRGLVAEEEQRPEMAARSAGQGLA